MKMRMDPRWRVDGEHIHRDHHAYAGLWFIHMQVIGDPNPMMPDGFEGASILGYSNADKRDEQTWVDSLGTVMM